MWLWRNPEIKKHSVVWGFLTAAAVFGAVLFCGLAAAVYVFVVCLAAGLLFWKWTEKRYEDISELSARLNHLLHSPHPLQFVPDEEGELALLSSEIQKLTLRLVEQAEELKKEKAYLKDSLADVSHQIRTPLTSIRMIAPRLCRPDLPDAQRIEYAREISRLLNRMEWQVSVLLKIARLESGTVQMESAPVNVRQAVDQAWEPLAIPAELKNIALKINVEGSPCFQGDLAWTVEALGNVLKNCVEHLSEGEWIELTASQNPIYTELCIADNGPGIPGEELTHLFERFYRGAGTETAREATLPDVGDAAIWEENLADAEAAIHGETLSDTEAAHGATSPDTETASAAKVGENAGIGLALAQMIVRAQNGSIRAGNRRGGGAEFQIRFYRKVTDLSLSSHGAVTGEMVCCQKTG